MSQAARTSSTIIAIDGPAGAGKSSVAKVLAQRLGVFYLDTGAMYRAVGLLGLRAGITPPLDADDGPRLAALADGSIKVEPTTDGMRISVDGEDVSESIRSPECSSMASAVSALAEVRRALVPEQRRLGRFYGGVMEGRDIGSVVFPDADVKVFLTATATARARRRLAELHARGIQTELDTVLEDQRQRDLRDTSRADSPLMVAPGSVVIDTTLMDLDQVVERIRALVDRVVAGPDSKIDLDTTAVEAIRSRNHGG